MNDSLSDDTPPKLRLGLDLGTNSIGWCLLKLDENDQPCGIHKVGVRIFSNGRNPKSYTSLKAERRSKRGARRNRDRYIRRRAKLMNTLIREGLMPNDEIARKKLEKQCPYEIRARALDKEIEPHHFGRALFHLNQRRGFQSNRIGDSADKDSGVVKDSIERTRTALEKAEVRTLGELLQQKHERGNSVRARRWGTTQKDLYDVYADRDLMKDEFEALWQVQSHHRPAFYSDEKKARIFEAIFHQRPLKPVDPGLCTFLWHLGEKRAPKALPSFQRFRILQEIDSWKIYDINNTRVEQQNWAPYRRRLAESLNEGLGKKFDSIENQINKWRSQDGRDAITIDRGGDTRKRIDGNPSYAYMYQALRKTWSQLHTNQQDQLVLKLVDSRIGDDKLEAALNEVTNLSNHEFSECLRVAKMLPKGYGSLSKAAIDRILIHLENNIPYDKAVEKAGLGPANLYQDNPILKGKLAYYGSAMPEHVMNATRKEKNELNAKRYGFISNPSVHIALNQLRALFNELVRLYGKPYQIVIETGRELPMGPDSKREYDKKLAENKEKNEKIHEAVKEYLPTHPTQEDRQKYKLWEELGDRRCPFSGKTISLNDLFYGPVEIEHILPFSRTLDDSMANKTLCYKEANQEKNNQTPFEAFGHTERWSDIAARAENMPANKSWRFREDAMERFEEEQGFLKRQLNDSRYIARITRKYLATCVHIDRIYGITGQLTAKLRNAWGLQSILGELTKKANTNAKNRDDHRHHIVDAVTVALTSRSLLQQIHAEARKLDDHPNHKGTSHRADLFFEIAKQDNVRPWPSLRGDLRTLLEKTVVSHRSNQKDQGALHNETAYGLTEHFDPNTDNKVVHRVPVSDIVNQEKVKAIHDTHIRQQLLSALEAAGSDTDTKTFIAYWFKERKIRRIRIYERLSVIAIKHPKSGKHYKAFKPDSNAFMDISLDPKGKWQGKIVRMFDARQKASNQRTKPLMRLRINDMLRLGKPFDENGQAVAYSNRLKDLTDGKAWGYVRVQKLSDNVIALTMHNEANVDGRSREITKHNTNAKKQPLGPESEKIEPVMQSKSPSALQKLHARKVHISPSGLIKIEPLCADA